LGSRNFIPTSVVDAGAPEDDDAAHPFLSSEGNPLLDSILLRLNRKSYDKNNQEIFKSETMSQDQKGV
jgi:hypothetical protein